MTILPVSNVKSVAARYDQQRFYAERASKINAPKTYQMGITDHVSISSVASSTTVQSSGASTPAKSITYDDPRKELRRQRMESRPMLRITESAAEFKAGIEVYRVEQERSRR